jgi:hypothetical protein
MDLSVPQKPAKSMGLWGRVLAATERHTSEAKFVAENRNSVAWVRREIRQGLNRLRKNSFCIERQKTDRARKL